MITRRACKSALQDVKLHTRPDPSHSVTQNGKPRKAIEVAVHERTGSFIFTRAGILTVAFVTLLGAWFGYGTLVLLGGLTVATYFLGWFWAKWSLSRVSVEEELTTTHCFPGTSIKGFIKVQNAKVLPIPRLSVKRKGYMGLAYSPGISEDGVWTVRESPWLLWNELFSYEYQLLPLRRGIYDIGETMLESGDPFGLFTSKTQVDNGNKLVVYPASLPLESPELRRVFAGMKMVRHFLFPDPLNVAGVRPYYPDDPARLINWVSSVRTQSLKSNVMEGSTLPQALIILVISSVEHPAVPQNEREYCFELLVSLAGTLAVRMFSAGIDIGLCIDACESGAVCQEMPATITANVLDQPSSIAPALSGGSVVAAASPGPVDACLDKASGKQRQMVPQGISEHARESIRPAPGHRAVMMPPASVRSESNLRQILELLAGIQYRKPSENSTTGAMPGQSLPTAIRDKGYEDIVPAIKEVFREFPVVLVSSCFDEVLLKALAASSRRFGCYWFALLGPPPRGLPGISFQTVFPDWLCNDGLYQRLMGKERDKQDG